MIKRITQGEMAAQWWPHRARLVKGATLEEALRGAECYQIDSGAIALQREAPGVVFVSLAVNNSPAKMIDNFNQCLGDLCKGCRVYFHTKRRGFAALAAARGWTWQPLEPGEFEFSKVY